MAIYRVKEYRSYTLTFEVEAESPEEAEELAEDMSTDEGDEEELGKDDVEVTLIRHA